MRNMLALFWAVAAAALLGSTSSSAARVLSQTNSSSVDLPFVNWPTLLGPTITDEDSARNYCAQVGLQCTELLIQEMRRRYNGLKGTCDHNAVFSLLYLRVTEGFYNVTAAQPNYWQDANFVIWYSFYFATFYLEARDNYAAGQTVAEPWRLAFQSADQEKTTGTGDLLLGVNAHVNHDLAFALAHVGLTAPDGSSRKPDHDKVNDVLRAVGNPCTMELGCRLDPSISASNFPNTTADDDGIVYLLITWREQAWRNAERLVAAANGQSTETYDQVVASINANSIAQAQSYIATNSYVTVAGVPVGDSAQARDAYCAIHKDDASCAQNYGY